MPKPLMVGLVLASLLTGCKAPVVLQAAPLEKERVVTASMAKKYLPAGTPTVGAKANTGIKPNMTPRGGAAIALAGTNAAIATSADDGDGGTTGTAGAPAALKLVDTESPTLKLVPILDDNDQFASMMASPADGALTWQLQGAQGPLSLTAARLVLRREATRLPLLADTSAAPVATPSPVPPVGEPMSFDLALDAIGLPDATKAGGAYSVRLTLLSDEARRFVEANPTASEVSVALTILGGDGAPVPGANGAPLVLTARVTVL